MQRRDDGGLGAQLIGDKIPVNYRSVQVSKLIGEGGFSYVYLVKDISDKDPNNPVNQMDGGGNKTNGSSKTEKNPVLVLKVTSIHSRQQRDIAEKEAKLLSRLSHPSIIRMYDSCYRTAPATPTGLVANIVGVKDKDGGGSGQAGKEGRPQHLILMEFCEGGHALDVCNKLASAGQRFDLSALIIAFGQICNAVSYLHAQRPPIVHRDLKPVNFLVKNGAYKLCDFGSAVFGHIYLKSHRERIEAEEVIQKTTTQMFRAPEMVDIFMGEKLTQSTDVWALGCCLYSLAFLQNCFEEGSNLAIISRNYKIPDDNPYGEGLVELIDRMLTVESKARADMTEVILCLSAIYSGKVLPPRKKRTKDKKTEEKTAAAFVGEKRITYKTDGQGYREPKKSQPKKAVEAKKLNPESVAARRIQKAQAGGRTSASQGMFDTTFPSFDDKNAPEDRVDRAFCTDNVPFAGVSAQDERKNGSAEDVFQTSFSTETRQSGSGGAFRAFDENAWGDNSAESNGMQSGGLTPDIVFTSFEPSEQRSASAMLMANGMGRMEAMNVGHSMDGQRDPQSHKYRPRGGTKKESRRDDKPRRRSSLKGAAAI